MVPGGPAAKAGLRHGDVITAVDGKLVNDVGHFRNLIAGLPASTKLKLTILRDGREQGVEVTVGELSERGQAAPSKNRPDHLGVAAVDVTPEVARNGVVGARRRIRGRDGAGAAAAPTAKRPAGMAGPVRAVVTFAKTTKGEIDGYR